MDGPISQSENIFNADAAVPDEGPDPLGNLALDPGFSKKTVDEEDQEPEVGDLFENPALAPKRKKKKKEFHYEPQKQTLDDFTPEPFEFRKAIKEVWFLLLIPLLISTGIGVLVALLYG